MPSLPPATPGGASPAGAGTFHFTFLAGPNSTGGFSVSATPEPPGPRNWGHASGLSPPRPAATNAATATSAIDPFTLPSSLDVGTDGTGGRPPPRLRSAAGRRLSARGVSPGRGHGPRKRRGPSASGGRAGRGTATGPRPRPPPPGPGRPAGARAPRTLD